jgi:hypothetical protein
VLSACYRRSVAFASALLALWPGSAAAKEAHVGIALSPRRPVSASIRNSVIDEAARVWKRYDIQVDGKVPTACDGRSMSLLVVLDRERPKEEGEGGLGAIRFTPDGSPDSTITLHYDTIAHLATSQPVMGVEPLLWPPRLRDEITARAVGRALAHEIGHYLLRWPHHAKSGLMRGELRASALADPTNNSLVLDDSDRARLALALRASPLVLARSEDGSRGVVVCPTGDHINAAGQ